MFSALTFDTPSIVTSLVALRPPLMNGEDPGAGATPGASVASENGLRPFNGRSTSRLFSIVWLTVELVVSIVALRPTTVISSAACPSSSETSTPRICWTSSLTSSIAALLNPDFATVIL